MIGSDLHQQDAARYQADLARLTEENGRLTTICAERQSQVTSLESDKRALKQRCDDHEEGRRAERAAAQTLREKIIVLEQANQRLNEINEHLQSQNTCFKQEKELLDQANQRLKERCEDLEKQCAQNRIKIAAIEAKNQTLKEHCNNCEAELLIARSENDALAQENTACKEQKERADEENQRLAQELATTKKSALIQAESATSK